MLYVCKTFDIVKLYKLQVCKTLDEVKLYTGHLTSYWYVRPCTE